ncbi:LytR/AlgR family response regulator transcription factor [Dyella choica]|uniref:Response regulator transcription factor n=1 Tax=Dyella choica TaxID=1927959 RepID=A0A3S0R412_9GAMM|nr:LytTR family DNA-binding domain-containing protein [Dyella choica]RUL76053.1 response regulator transcription factor [Dyella choica]
MTMRVLIVDDEPLARRGVALRLSKHQDIELIGEAEDGEAALTTLAANMPDLVFMDVQMPGMSGLEVLRLLSPLERPFTIFLTAYDRFALQAFEVHALDYLLKPIDDDRFSEAVERARQAHASRQPRSHGERMDGLLDALPGRSRYATRFAVRIGHRVAIVPADQVDWIEAAGDYVTLHADEREYLMREPLHRLAARLDPSRFVRVHRSALVCVDRIAEIRALPNKDCMLRLRDGTPLRASRTYGAALRLALEGHGSMKKPGG